MIAKIPGLTLDTIIKQMDAQPKTAEMELVIADFMMLPPSEQNRILLLGLIQNSGSVDWCVEQLKRKT